MLLLGYFNHRPPAEIPKAAKTTTPQNTMNTTPRIIEGFDHFNQKPLYKVISDNCYVGEWHDERNRAQKELINLCAQNWENVEKEANANAKKTKDETEKEIHLYHAQHARLAAKMFRNL